MALTSSLFAGNQRLEIASHNSPPLRKGEQDQEAVKRLQKGLKTLGFTPANSFRSDQPDGVYGQGTWQAVFDFQRKYFPNDPHQWDGTAGTNTLGKMDELLRGAPPIPPGPTPPSPPPGRPAIRTVKFYMNGFIPRDVPPLTFPVLNGPHKGETFLFGPPLPGLIFPDPPAVNPFLLDPPLPIPAFPPPQPAVVRPAFLTNSRGFDNSESLAVNFFKLHAEVTVDFSAETPVVRNTTLLGGQGVQIDLVTGAEIQKIVSSNSRMRMTRLFPVPTPNPFLPSSPRSVAFQLHFAVSNPLIPLAGLIADIDVVGVVMIDPEGLVTFDGLVDRFPAYEAYVKVNDFRVFPLFQLGPDPGDSPMNLPGPPTRPIKEAVAISG